MKLLITGGHLTPALAVIDEIQSKKSNVKLVFVGRKYIATKHEESLEYKEIAKRKIQFIHLRAGRFSRTLSFQTLVHLLQIPSGFWNAYKILRKQKPDRVLCFGGYLALPVAVMANLLHIPVYTHEQTIHPGLANRIIGRFAKKIFVSFKESQKYFNKNKVVVSGNPIRKQVLEVIDKPFSIKKERKVIYITGGSTGAHSVNVHIENILLDLLEEYIVIHQTGSNKQYKDYQRMLKLQSELPNHMSDYYFPREHFGSDEIGYVYSVTDLVIGRAGANTFFELLTLKKPALFIPLPWAAHNEQLRQAEVFKKWGVGEVFTQKDKSTKLLTLITKMMGDLDKYQKNFKDITIADKDYAVQTIIKTVVG